MPPKKSIGLSKTGAPAGVLIERAGDVLTFTLDNAGHGNEVTGAMFDAMLAELRGEAAKPIAQVLRIRARGRAFCAGGDRGVSGSKALIAFVYQA